MTMQVCLFTDADVFAGTERHIYELGCGLVEAGLQVQISCPSPSPLATKAEAHGIPVLPVGKHGLIDRAAIQIMAGELRAGRIEVLHAHNGRTALIAALAVQIARKGVCVATQHFLEPNHVTQSGFKAIPSHLAHHWVRAKTKHFIAISQAVTQNMLARREAPVDKITVVPNGLSCETVSPEDAAVLRAEFRIAPYAPLLVCVARLEAEKGIASLLAAFRAVGERVLDARLLVVGEGSQRQGLEAEARELGIARAVQFAGFREDARTAIAAADVFVLPSPAEPFGLVLLEAMALGKAVVAMNAGGPREIVVMGETGLLVPPDDPAALAEGLVRLLSAPGERQRLGDGGRRRYEEHFTTQRMADATRQVYERAVGQ